MVRCRPGRGEVHRGQRGPREQPQPRPLRPVVLQLLADEPRPPDRCPGVRPRGRLPRGFGETPRNSEQPRTVHGPGWRSGWRVCCLLIYDGRSEFLAAPWSTLSRFCCRRKLSWWVGKDAPPCANVLLAVVVISLLHLNVSRKRM